MARSPSGILYVGTRGQGKVYALIDKNKDQKADEVITLLDGLNMPNGVAIQNGSLYVAEIGQVLRYDNIEKNLRQMPKPVVVTEEYPEDTHHGWKFIRFGPDKKLYVPVGAPCNVCEEKDPLYSSLTRLDPDKGGKPEIFAHGIRNTVGFDWHPETGALWFTDNGRDLMGDNIPPDELNAAPEKGMHFGFPYCHGKNIPDPKFGKGKNCGDYLPAAQELGPHVAALGMRFYTGQMFPLEYKNQIFIAEHGSWNRSSPLGYRVTLVRIKDNKAVKYETFAEGWLKEGDVWGRPVDVEVMPDGALLVSDDRAGAIYRITYRNVP